MPLLSNQRDRAAIVAVAFLILATACGGDATLTTTGSDRDAAHDAELDTVDLSLDPADENGEDDRAPGEPDSGGGDFMEPCEDDGDCFSGYCIPFDEGYVCTDFCTSSSCPEGWSCRVLENTGADAVRLCIPDPSTLCSPCVSNTDCNGRGSLCIDVGGSRVCGTDCSEDEDACPEGFFCSTRLDPAGVQGRQCVPSSEQCSCRPDVDGTDRPCVRQNEHGICEGIEVCLGAEGWSQCTADIPAEETCDGVDNDCDGPIDEDLAPRTCYSTPNEIGTCEGTETCEGSRGWICDARQASIEICDGLDNDCNGVVDDGLCFDGNPCTLDLCDPENPGGCSYPPRTGSCDDANVCTDNDRCIDGACTGTPRNCDDSNGCTADSCDPVAGCQHSNLSGTPCEVGNFCTADVCQDGACIIGPAISCGGSNQCNVAGCNPATGCTLERLTGNPCDDDSACTLNDVCSNGSCVGGTPYCQGRPCSNCEGSTWNIELGAWCVELLGAPICLCICI